MPLPARAAALLSVLTTSPALACPDPAQMDLPYYAEITLQPVYEVNPFTVTARGYGVGYVRDCDLEGDGLAGYDGPALVDVRPDFVLHLQGVVPELALSTRIQGGAVLLVRDPDGSWHLSDPGPDHDARIVVAAPPMGDYAVYVGRHGEPGGTAVGELTIDVDGS